MRITVRQAAEADLPHLLRLLDQMDESMYASRPRASDEERAAAFRRLLADPDQRLLVAEAGGRLVGTAHLIVLQHFDRGLKRSGVVEGVVVDGAYRGRGVGAALLRAVAQAARGAGCYKLSLTSNMARRGAQRFYTRLGWKRTHYGYSLDLG